MGGSSSRCFCGTSCSSSNVREDNKEESIIAEHGSFSNNIHMDMDAPLHASLLDRPSCRVRKHRRGRQSPIPMETVQEANSSSTCSSGNLKSISSEEIQPTKSTIANDTGTGKFRSCSNNNGGAGCSNDQPTNNTQTLPLRTISSMSAHQTDLVHDRRLQKSPSVKVTPVGYACSITMPRPTPQDGRAAKVDSRQPGSSRRLFAGRRRERWSLDVNTGSSMDLDAPIQVQTIQPRTNHHGESSSTSRACHRSLASQGRENMHKRMTDSQGHTRNPSLSRSRSVGPQRSPIDNSDHRLPRYNSLDNDFSHYPRNRLWDTLARISEQYADEASRERRLRSHSQDLQRLHERLESLASRERTAANRSHANNSSSSISRILMLAEALFEVLDELHGRNEAMASGSSRATTPALPAPEHILKSLPIKRFTKCGTSGSAGVAEASQCYICLMDYEEGDFIRVLPCQHEFHQSCVDKWLREIHRVCPLCRGNVYTAACTRKKKPMDI